MEMEEEGWPRRRRRRLDVAVWSDAAVRMLVLVMRILRYSRSLQDDPQDDGGGGGKSTQVWKRVARALQLRGHPLDGVQCKTKFKALKADYHAAVASAHCDRFKFLDDMRHYFAGVPVAEAEFQALFDGGHTLQDFSRMLLSSDADDASDRRHHAAKRRRSEACQQSREEDEYRAAKLRLLDKEVQLQEQRLELEVVRADNERQRLANESRRICVEERRLKHDEEQLHMLNTLVALLSALTDGSQLGATGSPRYPTARPQ